MIKEKSIKENILSYLNNIRGFVYGGNIEDHIRSNFKNKASTVAVVLRLLAREGKIERRLVLFKDKKVVQYRIADNLNLHIC